MIARAGLCSRRDAEAWIGQGRVAVNGRVLDTPAVNVAESDAILVDGKQLAQRERTRLWLFHKPRGTITTDSDPEGRPTIFEALPEGLPRVVTIGRLDFNTEGLLLLTNDGGLARALELPATGWLRRYRVRANGQVDQGALDSLAKGVTIEGVDYAGIEATLDRAQGANVWLTLGLREGKNREVKRVLEHLGLAVNRLIRLSFGPFQLGELAEGAVSEIRTRVLRDQLGETIARQAGVDFDAPVREETERAPAPVPRNRERFVKHEPAQAASSAPVAQRPEPEARKHVSAMREERARDQRSGPRKRIERDATADRHGRTVPVERIKPAGGAPDRTSRNGRRFASGHATSEEQRPREARPGRERPPSGGRREWRDMRGKSEGRDKRDASGRQPRSERPDRAERGAASGPSRSEPQRHGDFGDRKSRPGREQDSAPRQRREAREGDQKRFSSRPPRDDSRGPPRAARPFRENDRSPGRERPERPHSSRDDAKRSGTRAPRAQDTRPGRDAGGGRFEGKPGGRPAGGRFGGKPGGRPGGGHTGKPGGRPGRPPRGR